MLRLSECVKMMARQFNGVTLKELRVMGRNYSSAILFCIFEVYSRRYWAPPLKKSSRSARLIFLLSSEALMGFLARP